MSDPERLIDGAGSPEARLLSSALDEPPPADLLARTLATVGAAAPGTAAATGSTAGKASATGKASAAAGKAGAAAAAKAAGSGILGAAALGTLAGVLAVGGYGLVTSPRAPPPSSRSPEHAPAAIAASATPHEAPAVPDRAAPAPAPTPPAPSAALSGVPHPGALAAELELLDEARRALREGDPARAIALLDRRARQIPRGQLGREAAKLRAEAEAARDGGDWNP